MGAADADPAELAAPHKGVLVGLLALRREYAKHYCCSAAESFSPTLCLLVLPTHKTPDSPSPSPPQTSLTALYCKHLHQTSQSSPTGRWLALCQVAVELTASCSAKQLGFQAAGFDDGKQSGRGSVVHRGWRISIPTCEKDTQPSIGEALLSLRSQARDGCHGIHPVLVSTPLDKDGLLLLEVCCRKLLSSEHLWNEGEGKKASAAPLRASARGRLTAESARRA